MRDELEYTKDMSLDKAGAIIKKLNTEVSSLKSFIHEHSAKNKGRRSNFMKIRFPN